MDSDDEEDDSFLIGNRAIRNFNIAFLVSEISVLLFVPLAAQSASEVFDKYLVATIGVAALEWIIDDVVFGLMWWRLNKKQPLLMFIDVLKMDIREAPN